MEFIDWCSRVLHATTELRKSAPQTRSTGADTLAIAAMIFGQDTVYGPTGFHGSERHQAVHEALEALAGAGLLATRDQRWWRVSDLGERVLGNEVSFWQALAQAELTPERRQLLEVVNRHSPVQSRDYARLEWVDEQTLLDELAWSDCRTLLHAVARELEDRSLVRGYPTADVQLRSTYQGMIWTTKRHLITPLATRTWPTVTPRQQRLLFNLVDWSRADSEGRDLQYVELDQESFFVGHGGHVERSDLEQLASKGYIYTRQLQPRGITFVSVTAEAHAYYEDHHRESQPAEGLVARLRDYVDTSAIAAYPEAAQRLQEASDALWSARRDADVTEVGFKCREAMQSFADVFYARFYPAASAEPIPKDKTGDLVSKVVLHFKPNWGERDTAFADALYWFWRRLIDLDQKVVHDTTTPDRPLTWEDGRRVLLYSYLVIGELHLLATGGRT